MLERKGRENVDTSNISPVLPIVSYKSVPSVKLVRPSQIVMQCGKWPEREPDLLSPSRSEVKIPWSCTSSSSYILMLLCLGSDTLYEMLAPLDGAYEYAVRCRQSVSVRRVHAPVVLACRRSHTRRECLV
jgi:hypothetical protein